MKAFILAAGKGERLKPFTETLAKPAIPFLNIPMLFYPVWMLKDLGIKEFHVNTHHLPKTIEQVIAICPDKNLKFKTYFEESLLGSAGPLAKARNDLKTDDDFILANGDTVCFLQNQNVLKDFVKFHKDQKSMTTIFLTPHTDKTKNHGSVWIDSNNQVRGFGKTKPENANDAQAMHYVGLIMINRECLDWFEEKESNIFYDVFVQHLNDKKIMGFVSSEISWYETGNIKDYFAALTDVFETLKTKKIDSLAAIIQDFFKDKKLTDQVPQHPPSDIGQLIELNRNLLK